MLKRCDPSTEDRMGTTSPAALELTGDNLRLADAARILAGQVPRLALADDARRAVRRSRRCVEELLERGDTLYGVNTGFGKLSGQRIAAADILRLQENLLRSHAVGRGRALPVGVARLALALRVQALAKGFSGVTPELLDRLLALYNAGVVPVIPGQGSVGASGDLAPLAHLALVLLGEGRAFLVPKAPPPPGERG